MASIRKNLHFSEIGEAEIYALLSQLDSAKGTALLHDLIRKGMILERMLSGNAISGLAGIAVAASTQPTQAAVVVDRPAADEKLSVPKQTNSPLVVKPTVEEQKPVVATPPSAPPPIHVAPQETSPQSIEVVAEEPEYNLNGLAGLGLDDM